MAKGSLFDNRKTTRSPQDSDYGGDISIGRDEVKYLYDQLKQFPDNPYPKLKLYGDIAQKQNGDDYIKINAAIPKIPFKQPQAQSAPPPTESGGNPWDED